MARAARLWRTMRWLKPEQVWGRLRFQLLRPAAPAGETPKLRQTGGTWVLPAQRQPSLVARSTLRFLAEQHDINTVGWDNATVALLWRYNLHYFDDLNAQGSSNRREWHQALLQRWCTENPPTLGTAWAPYPVSLRIVNWVKWFMSGQLPDPLWLHSLALQARWLMRRLEWHLLGNHLFANAKALVFAGLYFDGPEARTWLARGVAILQRELPEQVLPDGGQFERTPMYHALALEDVLDLINLLAAAAPAPTPAQLLATDLADRAAKMLHWLRCMQHPSGALSRFNDCAEEIAPPTADLERYAATLGVRAAAAPADGVHTLQPSGYVRIVRGAAVALLDVAPIGPNYLPGHAHADTLSFELSVSGRELVVNRGTSVYGTGARRQAERGTALHSTVQIGDENSSEVWSGFRVGRRARPGPVAISEWRVSCSHDGYAHLRGGPVHRRSWSLLAKGLRVEDRLEPAAQASACARFHFSPGLELHQLGALHWQLTEGGQLVAAIHVPLGAPQATCTLHAQRFGVLVESATLEVLLAPGGSTVEFTWGG